MIYVPIASLALLSLVLYLALRDMKRELASAHELIDDLLDDLELAFARIDSALPSLKEPLGLLGDLFVYGAKKVAR